MSYIKNWKNKTWEWYQGWVIFRKKIKNIIFCYIIIVVMKIKIVNGKKTYIYTASCYCNYCGERMRDVKLETNYELEDEEPFITVKSKRSCTVCSGKDE